MREVLLHFSDFAITQSYTTNQKFPKLYRIEQHESLRFSSIRHSSWAGRMDGIYDPAVPLIWTLINPQTVDAACEGYCRVILAIG